MSHIVSDRIERAWKLLNSAENGVSDGRFGKVLLCIEDSISETRDACEGWLDETNWINEFRRNSTNQLMDLEEEYRNGDLGREELNDFIEEMREKVIEAKEKCEERESEFEENYFSNIDLSEHTSNDYII